MTYFVPIAGVVCALIFIALYTPRERRSSARLAQELAPGETYYSLTTDLEIALADAVRELDLCQPHIMRDNWASLPETEQRKRVGARRRYIAALEAWRKAQECLFYDGANGNIDLRLIGSIPLVRRAGIRKAKESEQKARELQEFMRSEGWMQ